MPITPISSLGSPGRIGLVQIDAILSIDAPRVYDRTSNALEDGSPITQHRRREPQTIVLEILVSDAEPFFGASLAQLWEPNHARRTRERLEDIQDRGEEVTFFDGREFRRTPSGSRVWVIDEISPETRVGQEDVFRARVVLGESRRVLTLFTDATGLVDPSIAADVGGVAERGRQSGADTGAQVAGDITQLLSLLGGAF